MQLPTTTGAIYQRQAGTERSDVVACPMFKSAPPQTSSRSIQPFLHGSRSWPTDRQTTLRVTSVSTARVDNCSLVIHAINLCAWRNDGHIMLRLSRWARKQVKFGLICPSFMGAFYGWRLQSTFSTCEKALRILSLERSFRAYDARLCTTSAFSSVERCRSWAHSAIGLL